MIIFLIPAKKVIIIFLIYIGWLVSLCHKSIEGSDRISDLTERVVKETKTVQHIELNYC